MGVEATAARQPSRRRDGPVRRLTNGLTEGTLYRWKVRRDQRTRRDAGRSAVALSGVLGCVVAVIGGLVMLGMAQTDPVADVAVPTAVAAARTTTATPTTTPPPAVDAWTTTIATANGPLLTIDQAPPPDMTPDPTVTEGRAAAQASYAPYSSERAGAPEIPRLEEQVAGRRRTPTGWELDNPTSFDGPAVVVVTEDHGPWLRVLVPVRPNGSEGWVRRTDVTLTTTTLHIDINIGQRRLTLYDRATAVFDTAVIVGKTTTPTPTGRFFISDTEKKYAGSAYGPWILPLSGFSQVLDHFGGGAPALAIHGTNRPDLLGSAASNGCIRLPDDAITRLKDTVPMGAPVDIRA